MPAAGRSVLRSKLPGIVPGRAGMLPRPGILSMCRRRWQATLQGSTNAAAAAQPAVEAEQQKDLQEVLCRVRASVQTAGMQPMSDGEAIAHGTGKHLGSDVSWSFRWRRDGAFYEEVRSKHLTFKWGYDGGEHSTCWEVDPCGISKYLEYDDHESLLLAALVRSGCWLDPVAGQRLHMTLVPTEETRKALKRPFQGPAAGSSAPVPRLTGRGSRAPDGMVSINVRLKNGKMVAKVRVCASSWTPLGYSQPLCGDLEIWRFSGWKAWHAADVVFPSEVHHYAYAGGHHQYRTTSCGPLLERPLVGGYLIPPCPTMPLDATFDATVPPQVRGWQTGSGHMLVDVDLDGQHAGLMILDTGASGFVVEQRVADELKLERFGELHIAGITGKIQTRFRRATTLRIGPLTMQHPVLMEMPIAGLVKGAPSEVVGIVGYDIFRRAIVEIPCKSDEQAEVPTRASHTATSTLDASSSSSSSSRSSSTSRSQGTAQPSTTPGVVVNLRAGHAAAPMATTIDASPGISSREGHTAASSNASSPSSTTANGVSTAASSHSTPSPSGRAIDSTSSNHKVVTGNANGTLPILDNGSKSSSTDSSSSSSSSSRAESGRGASTSAPALRTGGTSVALTLRSPTHVPEYSAEYVWSPISMIANLPHVELTFQTPAGKQHTALFMIDSGAGGSDLMFHGRAAREMGLLDNTKDGIAKMRFVKGVGGSDQKTMRVQLCELPWLDWGGMRFQNVRALSATHGGLDISLYSAGIVCADLLMRSSVVLDYVHKRVGIRRTAALCGAL